jgi:hypothetical protein
LDQRASSGPIPGSAVRSGTKAVPVRSSMNLSTAAKTPTRAPPAMKPEAMSVPWSWRALATAPSFEERRSSQATAAPTTSGELSSMGRYMPSAKASPETPHSSRATAKTAPMP